MNLHKAFYPKPHPLRYQLRREHWIVDCRIVPKIKNDQLITGQTFPYNFI